MLLREKPRLFAPLFCFYVSYPTPFLSPPLSLSLSLLDSIFVAENSGQPPANAEHLLFSGCAPIQTEWKKESHRISTGTTVDHRGSFHRKCKHAQELDAVFSRGCA